MTAAVLIDALHLPADTRVEQRVPKKLLIEQGARTATDKRHIQDGIEELWWMAALKPTNIGIPEYRDDTREYLEISVLAGRFREPGKASRLVELIHRAIPYPLILATEQGGLVSLSLAHKRWSQGEAGKVVVEALVTTEPCVMPSQSEIDQQFLTALNLLVQPSRDLYALYQGWIDQAEAFAAARLTGKFVRLSSAEAIAIRRTALAQHDQLEQEIGLLRGQAIRETQLNRRVDFNMQIRELEQRLTDCVKEM